MATTSNVPAARTADIERRIDTEATKKMMLRPLGGGAAFIPSTVSEMMEQAKMMAVAGIGVRKHLRNNPGACLMVSMQAARWEMDPFAVANKSYEVNDQIAYESQLIAAVVNTRAPLKQRLRTRYEGEGTSRRCIVSGTLHGEDEPREVASPPIGSITPKNSPLWKSDPDQQLAYYTVRLWARREVPEVLLGVYDREELEADATYQGPEHARDVTPARPTRASVAAAAAEQAPAAEDAVDALPLFDAHGVAEETHFDPRAYIDAFVAAVNGARTDKARETIIENNREQIDALVNDDPELLSGELEAMLAPDPDPEEADAAAWSASWSNSTERAETAADLADLLADFEAEIAGMETKPPAATVDALRQGFAARARALKGELV